MSICDRPEFLRTVLLVDAATCVATGLVMSVGSNLVAQLTQLPAGLLMPAGKRLQLLTVGGISAGDVAHGGHYGVAAACQGLRGLASETSARAGDQYDIVFGHGG